MSTTYSQWVQHKVKNSFSQWVQHIANEYNTQSKTVSANEYNTQPKTVSVNECTTQSQTAWVNEFNIHSRTASQWVQHTVNSSNIQSMSTTSRSQSLMLTLSSIVSNLVRIMPSISRGLVVLEWSAKAWLNLVNWSTASLPTRASPTKSTRSGWFTLISLAKARISGSLSCMRPAVSTRQASKRQSRAATHKQTPQ